MTYIFLGHWDHFDLILLLLLLLLLVLGFEKFFPKSEESTGVNKSAEGEEGLSHHHKHLYILSLISSAVYDCYECYILL